MVCAYVACRCPSSSPSCFVRTCCVSIFVVGWFLLWVKRRPKFRWIFTVEAFVLVISISCCVFVVATLDSYIASVPHALMRSDVWLSVHRASCFAVALVGPFLWGCFLLALALGVLRLIWCCPRRSLCLFQSFRASEDLSDVGSRFLLKMLLRTASRCYVVHEKTCACSTKTQPPTSRSKHVSTQIATGSVTRLS